MTLHPDLFAALAAPFASKELKVRTQAGREFQYVTARTVMNRFDSVLGPENWWDEYEPTGSSLICKLTIRLPDGQVLTKCDAGGNAGMSDPGDDGKSGFSDAFKRAAVKFGCGRYLYKDGFAELGTTADSETAQVEEPAQLPTVVDGPVPRNGRGLFAWLKDQEQKHDVVLLRYMNNWGKLHELPSRIVDWDGEQVARAHSEAIQKLRSLVPDRIEVEAEALSN